MPVTADDIRLVELIASRFGGSSGNIDRDDVVSDGTLGLMTAVKLWDERRDLRERYGERRYFVRKLVERAIIDGLRARNGREKNGGYAKQRFRVGMLRLDQLMEDGEGGGDESFLDRFVGVEDESFAVVKEMLAELPGRERLIVWRTIVEGEPMSHVADELGLTEGRICQIRVRALARLRGEPVPMPREERVTTKGLLSSRELEVLAHLAEGHNNKEIAQRLTLSEETVKSHIRRMLSKLQAKSRTHAVTIGFRQGLVT